MEGGGSDSPAESSDAESSIMRGGCDNDSPAESSIMNAGGESKSSNFHVNSKGGKAVAEPLMPDSYSALMEELLRACQNKHPNNKSAAGEEDEESDGEYYVKDDEFAEEDNTALTPLLIFLAHHFREFYRKTSPATVIDTTVEKWRLMTDAVNNYRIGHESPHLNSCVNDGCGDVLR